MTTSQRLPGSREEDAWLSDEQLERCGPAEQEPFQGPVPTRMISNGEYMPHPQTEKQKHVEFRVNELADRAAKKLGITRRQFLGSAGGLAASFLAINEVFGNKFFKVSEIEMFEPAAAAVNGPPADLFVFDDHGNPWSPWNPAQLLPNFPKNPGPPLTTNGEFHLGQYINRMYLQAQTSVSIISNANIALFTPPGGGTPGPATNIADSLTSEILTGWQTSQCRDFINQLAGSQRALAHGQIYPGAGNMADPMFGDYTQWQIENMQPDSWKGYNVAFAASASPGMAFARWRLDDEVIAYPTYGVIMRNAGQLARHPGFFNICIHKGLSANGTQPGGPNNLPNFGNPDDMVKVATDWPMFNWIIYHACIRPGFWVLQSLQDIQNLPGAMPPITLTDSTGHTVPNIRWTTQFAQIAAGKYVAGAEPSSASPSSTRPLPNIYAELGTTMASMIVTFPTVWAHLIGQLLYYMGPNNIVFGSDSLWYGGPQWQIEALWRSQIPDSIAQTWGYPQLTDSIKRQILGLTSARLYGLTPTPPSSNGNLASFPSAPELQPGGSLDMALRGPGFPEPVMPASLFPSTDRFAKARQWAKEMKMARSNV